MKGTIVVDEIIVPIVDMYLDQGLIWFVAEVNGPVPAVDSNDYVVNDRSGATVFQGTGITGLKWDQVPAGSRLWVCASVVVRDREAIGL